MRRLVVSVALLVAAVAGGCSDDDEGDPAAFCANVRGISSIEDLIGAAPAEQDPATSLRTAGERLRQLAGDAPGEVAGDVRRLADAVEVLADAAADPDVGVAGRLGELDREELMAAAENLERYVSEECGLDLGGSTTSVTSATSTTSTTSAGG